MGQLNTATRMSFLTAKELHCDGCSEWMRLETGLLSREWADLRKEGWTREGGRHYCPDCGLNGSWENHPTSQHNNPND
jgi:hypothetical protein